jgi:hypothetical protein
MKRGNASGAFITQAVSKLKPKAQSPIGMIGKSFALIWIAGP